MSTSSSKDLPAQMAQETSTKPLPPELRLSIYNAGFSNDTIDLNELYRTSDYGSALGDIKRLDPVIQAEFFKHVQLKVTKKPLLNNVPNLNESLAILGQSNVERARNLQVHLPGSLTVCIHLSNRAPSVEIDQPDSRFFWMLRGGRHVISAKPNNPVLSESVDQLVMQFLAKHSGILDEMLAVRLDGLFLTSKQMVTLVNGMEVHLGFRTMDMLNL